MAAREDCLDIFLQPGEFYFGDADTRIRTILGSCVAITMWHPIRLIGGMCHYLLPGRDTRSSGQLDGRYGSEALVLFLREMAKHETTLQEYQVKVFGGGNMFPALDKRGRVLEIGARNIEMAREVLEDLGASVVAEHVGDVGHRNIIFDVWSGDVWVRHTRLADKA